MKPDLLSDTALPFVLNGVNLLWRGKELIPRDVAGSERRAVWQGVNLIS